MFIVAPVWCVSEWICSKNLIKCFLLSIIFFLVHVHVLTIYNFFFSIADVDDDVSDVMDVVATLAANYHDLGQALKVYVLVN